MENENTQYQVGDADEFTIFLFSEKPKEPNTIKLELDNNKDIKIGLNIFQELLMIFTEGIKYLFSCGNDKVDVSSLTIEDIDLMGKYFESMGFKINVEKFTIGEYLDNIKLPNYFKDQHLIETNTMLRDIYYEATLDLIIYRISFDFL
tara:strand:- start:418 stop:861 length:444 start_codon:yes stop_codon:yes gene_type:complete